MADGGRIDFTVGFKSDTQGLQQIKAELNELRKITPTMLKEINPTWDMSKARSEFMKVERTINEVSKAFDNAFNPQLGITNIQKLNSSLQKIGIDKIYNQFSSLGAAGTQAFQKLASQALTTNIRLKESSTILDKIGNSLMNTIKWNISSSVVNRFTNSIQQAWGYVKHLDTSLNNIRIVTGKSADEMDRFAEKANKAAKRLGSSTTDYTEASLIYYQQGLSDEEAAARAETTIKAANVTRQSGEAVSEQLTAVWNGYKVSAEEAELYIDKIAAVAATTASDLEELSTGMSRVASAASIMGVDIDQLNAQLATIVSVTREAPESIGTALKTVYARMSDIKAGLDGEVSLDEYTKQMASMGINVLDANNNLRDMGEVIEEIGGKWQSMSREQQTSLAQTIAGTRQYSRMMALFDNWGMYTKALETSANAAGTLNEQNEIYLESTEAHLQQLRTSIEGVYDSLIDKEGMNDLIDVFTNIVTLFNHFIDGAGGAKTVLMLLGTVGVKAFAKPMQDGLVRLITNFKIAKDNAAQLKAEIELTQALSNSKAMENPLVKQMVEAKQAVQQYYGVMSQADLEQSNALINQLSQAQALEAQWKKDADAYNDYAKKIVSATAKQGTVTKVTEDRSNKFNKGFDITKDKNTNVNMEALQKSSKNVDTILNSTNEELKNIKKLTTEWNKAQAGVNQNGKTSKELFQDIKTQASTIAKEMLANADIFDALGVDVTKVSALLKKVKIGDPQSIVDFRKELEALLQEAQKTKGQFDNLGDSAKTGLDGAKLAAQQAKAAFDNFLNTQSIKNFSQGLTGTISSIGQLGMGLTSLTNLPKIFDNENLSAGEKFAQILSSLSMGVVSFTTGLSGLIKGIKLITQSIPLATTALKTLNTEQQLALATRLTGNTVTDATVAKNAIETATTWELIKAKAALNAANLIALATAAALLAATFAITAAVNAEKKAREEEAAISANRSKIAQKNLEKANEEKKKIDELALSYEKLREQERIGEISKADMAKQTAELIDQYGDENTQLIEMTGNYEKLEEAIRNAQAAANEDTISSAQFAQTAAGDKAAGEMWRDMTGAQRDTVKGKRAIDLGTEKDVDEIADVLKEFGDIERLGSGHISLEDVTEAIQTDAQGFIKALEENGSSAATELLSILRATEGLDEAITAQTSEIGAKIDQINSEEPIKEGSITTVEDFNNAVDSLTEQYVAAGKTEEEAYQMAYDYVSGIDETTKLIGGLNKNLNPEEWDAKKDSSRGALEKNIEVFDENPYSKSFFNDADSVYKDNITALQNEVDKIMAQNTAMSVSEAIDYALQNKELKEAFANLPGGENYLKYIKNIASNSLFKGETFEDLQKEASSLSSYNPTADKYRENYYGSQQNEFDYTQLRNDIIKTYATDNPNQAPFLALIENLPQKLYEQGYDTVDKAQGFIDQEIFNAKLKNFDSSASNLLAGIQPLVENARYITPERLAQDQGWKDISAYEDILRVKGLGDEFDTVQDENATEEDRTAALQEIIGYLASISKVQDGLYTKEKAAEEGLTETALTDSLNNGEITQEQYQQKFQGAMDYELEELGINQEEFDSYTEAVKNLTEQYELSDEMVQRISKDNLKLQKTIDTLTSDWKEYGNVLKSGDKNNIKYAQGMGKIRESVEDMFGTDISDDFIQEHLDDIQKLAEGDLTIFDELQKAATQDILVDIQGVTDADQLSGEFAELNELIMNTDLENMEIGTSLDTTGFDVALQSMLDSGALTVDQVNAILAGVGFEPEITWKDVPVEQQSGIANDAHIRYKDSEGNMHEATMQSYLESGETGVIQIPVINGSKTSFKGAPKATTGKKKGGGGGGGGGGSAAKPDKKDFVDPETDRYHDVEVALKSINKQMEILNDNRKNLTGAALADSYREELELLDEQINALTQKQKLQKEEQKELQSQGRDISRDGKKVHIKSLSEQGVEFDDKGNITNYNEAIVNRTNEYNQMVESYNNLSADRQTDELKAQMDEAKKDYDQFIEDMERYETLTQDEMEETAKEIADALNKKIELKIEKFSMTIDLKIETREAEQSLEDFKSKMEHRDKTAAGRTKTAANKFKNYMDPETGVQAEIDRVNKIKDDIKKMQNGGHSDVYSEYDEESGTWVDNTAKAQEDLKKYTEQMMNDMEDMEDLMDEINQGLLDTFDEIQESFDDQIAGYDAVADQISHNISLIEKLYGDNASDKLGEWYDAQLDNSIGKVDMLKKEADFWQKQMENAENDDAYKKAKENWLKSMNELNAAVEDSLDIVIAKYENSIDQVFDKLNNSLTGGKGLKYVGEEWELINTNADRYLDTINATYEVQKLQGKYQDAIKNTDSISAQKKLNDLMSQEIKYLEKKDKLTQYDIDRANMKYDIALKQIALEEAQQNKSSLRLKRDSQGNYSYQYVGDEDDVAKKQQELIDAQNSLYNLDKDQYKQNLDDMYTYYSEFQEKMAEVAKTYGRDSEEYEKYKLLYAKQYGELINNIVAENEYIKLNLMESTYDELNSLYENDQASFEAMTHMNKEQFLNMDNAMLLDLEENLVPGFNGSIQDMINAFSGEEGFERVMKNVWNAISQAAKDFQTNIQTISKASGTDLEDLRVNTNQILTNLKGWVEENDKIIEGAEDSKAAYDKIARGIKKMANRYKAAKKNATDAATESTNLQKKLNEETWKKLEAQTALDNLVKKLKEWNNTKPKIKTFVTNHVDNSSGSGSGGSGGNPSGGGTPTPKSGSSTVKWYAYGSTGKKLSNTGYSSQTAAKNAWPSATKFLTYKTGGYTGTWANGSREENGKLALLHQKELVLNADDTDNFLKAMQELRKAQDEIKTVSSSGVISSMFNSISDAITAKIQNLQSAQADMLNAKGPAGGGLIGTIQNITINADFPEVSDANEIRKAFDQIIGMASQKANNKSR